jgi:diguanylate cyclase (GGDEF)-like protein
VAKEIHRRPGVDGQTRWIEVIAAPLRGPSGEILGVIESAHDITDHLALIERLKERELQLQHLAEHDPLTGLPNRLLFCDRLDQTLCLADREHRQAALLFVDLDRFKAINDSLGHAAGDQVLIQAARRMRAVVRASDTVARLGGDEFAVVLGTLEHGDDAGLVAAKLVDAFEQPFAVDGRMLSVTASIGIGLFPQDGTDVDALLRHADAAMYRAKNRGCDSFRYSTKSMPERALD